MNTSTVYKWVVDDVIAKMKPEVSQEGLDESVLDELRASWESKLVQKGLLGDEPPPASSAPTAHPPSTSAASQPPPTVAVPPATNFLPQGNHMMHPSIPRMPPPFFPGHPLAPGSFSSQLSPYLGAPGLNPHLAGMKRTAPEGGFPAPPIFRAPGHPPFLPQHDGPVDGDTVDDGLGQSSQPDNEEAGGTGNEDEALSSDSEEEDDEEADVDDFLCCQFEKVNRTKNRWKIAMKEGVFHIQGKDYLFKKAQGEWTF